MAEQILCAFLAHEKFLREANEALAPLMERANVLRNSLQQHERAGMIFNMCVCFLQRFIRFFALLDDFKSSNLPQLGLFFFI